eukprot:8623-Heterococcus_DN1.PRE.2
MHCHGLSHASHLVLAAHTVLQEQYLIRTFVLLLQGSSLLILAMLLAVLQPVTIWSKSNVSYNAAVELLHGANWNTN